MDSELGGKVDDSTISSYEIRCMIPNLVLWYEQYAQSGTMPKELRETITKLNRSSIELVISTVKEGASGLYNLGEDKHSQFYFRVASCIQHLYDNQHRQLGVTDGGRADGGVSGHRTMVVYTGQTDPVTHHFEGKKRVA